MPWTDSAPYAGFSTVEPWLPIPPTHLTHAVACQEGDVTSALNTVRKLIALRKAHGALREGRFAPLELPAPLLGFDRVTDSGRVRCLFNLSESAVTFGIPKEGTMLFHTGQVDLGAAQMGPLATCLIAMT
jgi:alpha-glucosidase